MGIREERMTRMATIEIKMLGGFEIRVNGKPVLAQLAQSRKATALVQYLVLRRGERVSHKVLTDTLWAGERSTNPDMALRAILHRFRNMIDAEGLDEMKGCIVTSRGYYQWNPHLDCSVDVFEVNDLSELARKEGDAEKRSRIYEQIVNLYDGRLLPRSASEPWVESVSVRLHGQYRTAILNLLELCKKWGESTRIVALCTRALELDPYEERLYLEKIVALETLGRHEEAQDLARRGSAMGCLHHAIEPGRAGSAYRQMRQADRNMESDVSKLISALPDTENTGACICDFETFKEIYRVQRGVQARYGLQVFLAILTMAPSQNTDAAETALMVEQLGDLIRMNLRQCDVAARYTDMQYVVMLSGSTAESGTGPMERLKAAYTATAVAEYFRDQHKSVLLMMDSVTRFGRAQREIGLAAGEPPTRRGFPPSVFSTLPKLMERAGNSDKGSITALYTVLVEGDDMTEPIADETRSILDGHIILSRKLAAANHYPAIDVQASVSRVMNAIVTKEHKKAAQALRKVLAKFAEVELLVQIGEYKKGSDKEADDALARINAVNAFLRQGLDEKSTFEETLQALYKVVA